MGIFDKIFGRQQGVTIRKQILPTLRYYKQVMIARAQWENLATVPLLNYRGVDIHLYGVPELSFPYKGCLDPFPGRLVARLDKHASDGKPNASGITDLARDFDMYVSDVSPFQQIQMTATRRLFDEAKFEFTDDVEENLELVRKQADVDRDIYSKFKFPDEWRDTLMASGCIPRLDALQMVGRQLPEAVQPEEIKKYVLPNPEKVKYCGLTSPEEKHRVLIMTNLSPEEKARIPFFKNIQLLLENGGEPLRDENNNEIVNTDPREDLRELYKSIHLDREDVDIKLPHYISSRLQSIVLGPNALRTYHQIIEKHMGSEKEYLVASIKQRCKIDKFIESVLDSCDELVTTQEKAIADGTLTTPKKLRVLGVLDRNLVHLIRQSWDIAVEDYSIMNRI